MSCALDKIIAAVAGDARVEVEPATCKKELCGQKRKKITGKRAELFGQHVSLHSCIYTYNS